MCGLDTADCMCSSLQVKAFNLVHGWQQVNLNTGHLPNSNSMQFKFCQIQIQWFRCLERDVCI